MKKRTNLNTLGSTEVLDFGRVICETFPVTSSHYQQWAATIKVRIGVEFEVVFAKYDCSSKHHAMNTIKGAIANMKSNVT